MFEPSMRKAERAAAPYMLTSKKSLACLTSDCERYYHRRGQYGGVGENPEPQDGSICQIWQVSGAC